MNQQIPIAIFKNIIVDRSGSMYTMKGQQIKMTRKILCDNTKCDNKDNTFISLTTFDDYVYYPIINSKILKTDDVPTISTLKNYMLPRGSTRFNDTLIEELDKLIKYKNDYYDKLHRKVKNLDPQIKMIAMFITDGHDNMSSSTVEECRDKVAEFKNLNGNVIFMSANMNAEEIGQKYGIDRDTCLTVHSSDTNAIQSGFNAIDNLQRSLSAGITNASFSQFDRTSSQGFVQTHNSTPNTLPQLQRATNVVNTLPTLDIDINQSQFY